MGEGWGRGWGHQPAGRAGYLKRFPTFPTVSPPLPHFLLSGTFQHILLIYILFIYYILNLSPPSPLILLARVIAGVKNAHTPRLPCRLISARRAPSNLLRRLIRRHVPDSRYLFPAVSHADRCMSDNTLSYLTGRMGYSGIATPHGFRSLATDILNENGWPPDVIERQLAHVEQNKVRAAYHRTEYLPQRKEMMQWYSDFLRERYEQAKQAT